MNKQSVDFAQPGVQKLHAGAGAKIKPGVYIVRVTQGKTIASQKVMVAQ